MQMGTLQEKQVQQTTTFVEEKDKQENFITSDLDPTYFTDEIEVGQLADFLSRPVLIDEITWTQTPYAGTTIYPWRDFFNHPVIKRKIDNYAFINCKLKVKVIVNANPFLYGSMIVSYTPTPAGGPVHATYVHLNSDNFIGQESQKPHIWVHPQTSEGGEMSLPFFWHKDWMELTNTSDVLAMGYLDVTEVVSLQSANGSTGQSVTVQVYAWAEDVHLSGPTYEVALQSDDRNKNTFEAQNFLCFLLCIQALLNYFPSFRGIHDKYIKVGSKTQKAIMDAVEVQAKDEYWKTPISSVASSIAAMATPLVSVPVIGTFAKATQIGASAVSTIAKLFGYTNPPVIDNVSPVRQNPYHGLASAELSVPADKLCLDPKNELTVDPRTVGLSGEDEMTIPYIAGRESYIGQFTWATSDAPGVDLFNMPVSPLNYTVAAHATHGHEFQLTPAGLLSMLFEYWRGDIIVRFRVIASKYHCGRMRIVWDPKSNLNTVPDNTPSSFNRVVDISTEQDVEVRIPYNQARHYLRCPSLENFSRLGLKGSIIANYYDEEYFNGNLHGYVINSLSAPETTANAQVLVFVRCAENIQFAVPHNKLETDLSYFEPQSGDDNIANSNMNDDQRDKLIFFGESIRSMRTVLRRSMPTTPLFRADAGGSAPTDRFYSGTFTRSIYPDTHGYDPSSPYVGRNIADTADVPVSYGSHSFFSALIPCYVGMRGSMIWHYEPICLNHDDSRAAISVARRLVPPDSSANRLVDYTSNILGASSSTSAWAEYFLRHNTDAMEHGAGYTLISQDFGDGKSVLFPELMNYRFKSTNPSYWNIGGETGNTNAGYNDSVAVSVNVSPVFSGINSVAETLIRRHFSIGPDFSAFFFLAVPLLHRYDGTPNISGPPSAII